MSHSPTKPLYFYFGIAILSLLLVTTSITATNNKYFYDPKIFDLPYFIWNYKTYEPHSIATAVYAQDEDEDEKDKDGEDEDEKEDEKDKEEEVSEEEALEEVSDQLLAITEEKNEIINQSQEITTQEQEIKQELNDVLVDGGFVNPYADDNTAEQEQPQPVVNTTQEISTVQPQPVVNTIQEDATSSNTSLNLSCNCTTINDTEIFKPKPKPSIIQPQLEPTQPEQQQQQPQQQEQIIIPKDGIKSWKTTGEITDKSYTDFYHVGNIFDNTINDYSFWSQYGKGSSFLVHLTHPIQDYQVCSVEINSANPKGVPFVLDIGASKNYTGVIDENIENITLDKCIKNVNKIYMYFDSDQKYTSVAELKLFGSKLTGNEEPQKPDPKRPKPPQPAPYKNMTKINISNSDAEINIQNSTVTFKFDPQSAKATNYNVITIPSMEVVN